MNVFKYFFLSVFLSTSACAENHNSLTPDSEMSLVSVTISVEGEVDNQTVSIFQNTRKGRIKLADANLVDGTLAFSSSLTNLPAVLDFYLPKNKNGKNRPTFSLVAEHNMKAEFSFTDIYGDNYFSLIATNQPKSLSYISTTLIRAYLEKINEYDQEKRIRELSSKSFLSDDGLSPTEEIELVRLKEEMLENSLSYLEKQSTPASLLLLFLLDRYSNNPEKQIQFFSQMGKKYPALKDSDLFASVKRTLDKSAEKYALSNQISKGASYIDFSFTDRLDNAHKFSKYIQPGRYVLLDFWASWCGGCRVEHGKISPLYEEFHSRGFDVVAISVDEDIEAWIEALDEDQRQWVNGRDQKSAQLYGVSTLPDSVLISPEGEIIARHPHVSELRILLEKLLN